MRLKRYYEQLNFIFDEMTVNDNQLFSEDGVRRLMTLRNRTDRYLSAVKNLQEVKCCSSGKHINNPSWRLSNMI